MKGKFAFAVFSNTLAFLRLTANLYPLRLTKLLKDNFHCFKKLKLIFIFVNILTEVLRPFWDKKVHFTIIVNVVNCHSKLHLPFLYCGRKIYIFKITEFLNYCKRRLPAFPRPPSIFNFSKLGYVLV